jgi:hypothetical protein
MPFLTALNIEFIDPPGETLSGPQPQQTDYTVDVTDMPPKVRVKAAQN